MLTTRRENGRFRTDSGVALVEFALVAPLLFALFLGTVTGGLAYNRKLSITDAVREGARFGATLDTDAATYPDWVAAVETRTADLSANQLKSAQVCVKLVKTPSTDLTASSSCPFAANEPPVPSGVAANTCLVKVWAQREAKLEAVIYSRTIQLKGSSVARYERNAGGACS